MKKIAVVIKDKSLYFKYKNRKLSEPNLLNTNVISNNELVFSDDYINENTKIVSMFISDIAKEHQINRLVVSNNELALLIIDVLDKLDHIDCFKIDEDDNLTYALCEKIIQHKRIKKLECFAIPQFMIELLDRNDIVVDSRNEVLFTSKFMAENNLSSYSKMYYKNSVVFGSVVTEEDLDDFRDFCNINKYLKVVHFDKASLDNIKVIVNILKELHKKNIVIQIHEDVEDLDEIAELKAFNKELKAKYKKYKLKLALAYSEDYIDKNYASQITFTTLKICAILIFAIVIFSLVVVSYNNYSSEKKNEKMKEEIKALLVPDENENSENTIEEVVDNDGRKIINSYNKLLEVNSDTVGWIKIKGTKIDYPIVRNTDNYYYLQRNFYRDKDPNGWVFMDYRNSIDELDDNTIIYAHNRYTSGVMFGTLEKVADEKFYSKDKNLIINFNTLYEQYKWKIFSFYSIDVTSDYLVTLFMDDEVKQKEEFFNMLKERSQVELPTKVTKDDKIITLSTCLDNNQRFVVHAVLIKE